MQQTKPFGLTEVFRRHHVNTTMSSSLSALTFQPFQTNATTANTPPLNTLNTSEKLECVSVNSSVQPAFNAVSVDTNLTTSTSPFCGIGRIFVDSVDACGNSANFAQPSTYQNSADPNRYHYVQPQVFNTQVAPAPPFTNSAIQSNGTAHTAFNYYPPCQNVTRAPTGNYIVRIRFSTC
jgi:hypothetical protein